MSSTLALLLLLIIVPSQQLPIGIAQSNVVSAVFVFGDSSVDPGNNNYLPTVARGNFPPYGKDFLNHTPTGRFSNGRLVTDFIASFVGVKENLPPYLDPSLTTEDLMTGVSFASAGSGYDPFTSKLSGALTASQQLDLFREYKRKMELTIGKERTDDLVKRGEYVVSLGTNDFAFNYYGPVLIQRTLYPTLHSYQSFLWQNIQKFLQDLLDEGARRIGVVGAPPIGCLPAIITINSKDPISSRQCIQRFNSVSRDYNKLLENNLKSLQTIDSRIVYADIYSPIINMVQGNLQTGFEEVHRVVVAVDYLKLTSYAIKNLCCVLMPHNTFFGIHFIQLKRLIILSSSHSNPLSDITCSEFYVDKDIHILSDFCNRVTFLTHISTRGIRGALDDLTKASPKDILEWHHEYPTVVNTL